MLLNDAMTVCYVPIRCRQNRCLLRSTCTSQFRHVLYVADVVPNPGFHPWLMLLVTGSTCIQVILSVLQVMVRINAALKRFLTELQAMAQMQLLSLEAAELLDQRPDA